MYEAVGGATTATDDRRVDADDERAHTPVGQRQAALRGATSGSAISYTRSGPEVSPFRCPSRRDGTDDSHLIFTRILGLGVSLHPTRRPCEAPVRFRRGTSSIKLEGIRQPQSVLSSLTLLLKTWVVKSFSETDQWGQNRHVPPPSTVPFIAQLLNRKHTLTTRKRSPLPQTVATARRTFRPQ